MPPSAATRASTPTGPTSSAARRARPSFPQLQKLEGFSGYYLIEAGNGVFSSVGLFKSPAQTDEATKIAAAWVKDEKLESALPNPPRITSGKVIAQGNGVSDA